MLIKLVMSSRFTSFSEESSFQFNGPLDSVEFFEGVLWIPASFVRSFWETVDMSSEFSDIFLKSLCIESLGN